MPVIGSAENTIEPALGVRRPPGSLAIFKSARDQHVSELVEILFRGDSTLFGELEGSAEFHPITNKMRELVIADGYTSAGRGWPHGGVNDDAGLAGALDPVCFTGRVGFALADGYGPAYSFKSSTQNDEVTLRGKGTICRLWYQPMNLGGAFTYSVNGAAAVTVSAATNQAVPSGSGQVYWPNFIYLTGLPGGGATNTIKVVNTGTGRVGVMAEFFNPAGIVIHNHGVQGSSSAGLSPSRTDNNIDELAFLGLTRAFSNVRSSEQMLPDPTTGARRIRLALEQFGVNDCQQSSDGDVTGYAENIGLFCRMARNAGADPVVVIPVMERLSNGRQYGTRFRQAAHAVARAHNAACVDANAILGPIAEWGERWGASDSGNNPHLKASQYDAIATAIHTHIVKAP